MNANPRDDADPNEIHRVIMFGFLAEIPLFHFHRHYPPGTP